MGDAGLGEEGRHVLEQGQRRDRMLPAGLAVHGKAQGQDRRGAFRRHRHVVFARRLDQVLMLLAVGDTEVLEGLHAHRQARRDVIAGILHIVDADMIAKADKAAFGDNPAGAIGARAQDIADLGQIPQQRMVDLAARGIAHRGHAIGQRDGQAHVAAHGDPVIRTFVAHDMRMHVDQAGNDGLAGHVHDGVAGGGLAFADAKELAFLDDDVALLDHLAAFHGDDLGADQSQTAGRRRIRHRDLQLGFRLLAGGGIHQDEAVAGNQLHFGRG